MVDEDVERRDEAAGTDGITGQSKGWSGGEPSFGSLSN